MDERESLLNLDFETVAGFIDQPDESFHSLPYLKELFKQVKDRQPALVPLLGTRFHPEVKRTTHFFIGALSTFDLIMTADPDYWNWRKVDRDTVQILGQNVTELGEIRDAQDDSLEEINLDWFYEKLTQDSQIFTDWVEYKTSKIQEEQKRHDFVAGVILMAMPFYMLKESEEMERVFGLSEDY